MEHGTYTFHPRYDGVFSHNPLHDLESLWWVGVWLLLCHYNPSHLLDSGVQKHILRVAKIGEKLFGLERSSRRDALVRSDFLFNQSKAEAFPPAVQPVLLAIFKFRIQLFSYYTSYKPRDPGDRSFFTPDIHRACGLPFSESIQLLEGTKNETAELWPLDQIRARQAYLEEKS